MDFHRAENLADLPGVAHGFFGRAGGVSNGLYESLNCGPGSKDDPAHVAANRARVVEAVAPGNSPRLITLAQIHSPFVHVVDENWPKDHGVEGDGLVSASPGLLLGIQTADCAPVLLADTEAGVIGAAHAGWKGALYGVLDSVIAAMEGLGARRGRIAAAVGPCISQVNYEVGGDFRTRFLEADAAYARFFAPSGAQFRFDLPGFVTTRLAQAGIGDVAVLRLCTYPAENGFFSFRRTTHRGETDYGREISVIGLVR